MQRAERMERLNAIFQEVFEDASICVTEATTAADIDGWDSLMHITLISAVEDAFDMKFKMKDIIGMKNVGEMISILEREA